MDCHIRPNCPAVVFVTPVSTVSLYGCVLRHSLLPSVNICAAHYEHNKLSVFTALLLFLQSRFWANLNFVVFVCVSTTGSEVWALPWQCPCEVPAEESSESKQEKLLCVCSYTVWQYSQWMHVFQWFLLLFLFICFIYVFLFCLCHVDWYIMHYDKRLQ